MSDTRLMVCTYCGVDVAIMSTDQGVVISINGGDTARGRGAVCACGCVIMDDGSGGVFMLVPDPQNGRAV